MLLLTRLVVAQQCNPLQFIDKLSNFGAILSATKLLDYCYIGRRSSTTNWGLARRCCSARRIAHPPRSRRAEELCLEHVYAVW